MYVSAMVQVLRDEANGGDKDSKDIKLKAMVGQIC